MNTQCNNRSGETTLSFITEFKDTFEPSEHNSVSGMCHRKNINAFTKHYLRLNTVNVASDIINSFFSAHCLTRRQCWSDSIWHGPAMIRSFCSFPTLTEGEISTITGDLLQLPRLNLRQSAFWRGLMGSSSCQLPPEMSTVSCVQSLLPQTR